MLKLKEGRPTYLTLDEEVHVVVMAEINDAHALPVTRKRLGHNLNRVLEYVGSRHKDKLVKLASKLRYASRIVQRVNKNEDEAIRQKKRGATGEIKLCGLPHKRAKQGCPRLAWIMSHKIYGMLGAVKNLRQTIIDRQVMRHIHSNQTVTTETTLVVYDPPFPTQVRIKHTLCNEEAMQNLHDLMNITIFGCDISPLVTILKL